MSPLKIGTRDVTEVKIGSRDVIRIMHGTREIWAADDGGGNGTPFTGIATVTNAGSNISAGTTRYGWKFTVGDAPLTVDKLRHYGNPLATGSVWRVMIHRDSDGASLASADITAAADAWAEESVTPVELEANTAYIASARCISGTATFYGINSGTPGVTFSELLTRSAGAWFVSGGVDTKPTSFVSGASYVLLADFGGTYEP